MITVEKLHKTYNKNRRNALHVLNDITLSFPEKGFVVLLGESGSGKTTLLNVIGGMDSFDSGTINIGETTVTKYRSNTLDDIRARTVGMVFQNYYLLPHESVRDNLAISLRLAGFTDETAIAARGDYLLEAVGMGKYAKRLAGQLSGGEQQRVAIARALAKNPAVVLADEPTGNLDSKNTLAIMRVLEQIAKEKLVIMVTHERRLAEHFADRVVELEDGRILADKQNKKTRVIDYATENDIYLGDLHRATSTSGGNDITVYRDSEEAFEARFILKGDTLYTDPKTPIKKIIDLRERTDVTIHEGSIKDDVEEIKVKPFDLDEAFSNHATGKSVAPVTFKTVLRQTMNRLLSATRGQRFLLFTFLIGAMIITNALSNIFLAITVNDDDFLTMPRETIGVPARNLDFDTLERYAALPGVSAYTLYEVHSLQLRLPDFYYQGRNSTQTIRAHVAPIEQISERDLMHGRLPENAYEVVLDAGFVRTFIFGEDPFYALDFDRYTDVLHFAFDLPTANGEAIRLQVVGVADTDAPVVFGHAALAADLAASPVHVYELHSEVVTLLAGEAPQKGEVLLAAAEYPGDVNDFTPMTFELLGQTMTVSGLYDDGRGVETTGLPMVSLDTVHAHTLESLASAPIALETQVFLYADNVSTALRSLREEGVEASHLYRELRADHRQQQLFEAAGRMTFSLIITAGTALSFFFLIRSSMISRVYEIGVLRSLGTKKRHIFRRFIYEAVILTSVSSLIGFALMNYLLASAQNAVGNLMRLTHVSFLSVMVGLIVIYGINTISGLIPVAGLLRRTPAQINVRYDI